MDSSPARGPDASSRAVPFRTPEEALRAARWIAFGLLFGCLSFGAVVVVLVRQGFVRPSLGAEAKSALAWIGGILAGVCFVASFALRGRPPEDPGERPAHALTRTIVALALNEGAVLANLTFSLVAGSLAPGLYAAAIGGAGLLLHFPTRARFIATP